VQVGEKRSRVPAIAAALCAAALLAVAPGASGATQAELSAQHDLLVTVNKARTARHLGPLRLSKVLSAPARRHSAYLARTGKLDHNGADGRPFYVRLYAAGFSRRKAVGENLGMSGGCSTDLSPEMIRMWLDSPAHRANLLSRTYRVVGIAVVAAPDCSNTVYTTDFGG